jgi:hypothetical protein
MICSCENKECRKIGKCLRREFERDAERSLAPRFLPALANFTSNTLASGLTTTTITPTSQLFVDLSPGVINVLLFNGHTLPSANLVGGHILTRTGFTLPFNSLTGVFEIYPGNIPVLVFVGTRDLNSPMTWLQFIGFTDQRNIYQLTIDSIVVFTA